MVQRNGTIALTGATSGIGLATALSLARRGRPLILQGPEPEQDTAGTVARVRAAGAHEVAYVRSEFTDLADVMSAAREMAELGRVDALSNEAVTREYPDPLLFGVAARDRKYQHHIDVEDGEVSIRVTRTSHGHRSEIVLTRQWAEGELESALDLALEERKRWDR